MLNARRRLIWRHVAGLRGIAVAVDVLNARRRLIWRHGLLLGISPASPGAQRP